MNNAIVRRAALATWDVLGWTFATALVIGVRHDFRINEVEWQSVVRYWLLVCAAMLVLGYATKFYRGRFLVGSFDEALGLAVHVGLVGVLGIGIGLFANESVPRSVPVLVPPVALLLCAAGRWFYRAIRERSDDLVVGADVRNALVYGAGEAGRQVLQLLRNERELRLRVVGFVDDNPGKRHLRILGVPVLGSGTQLEDIASAQEVDTVVLAIPGATGQFIGSLQERAHRAGLDILVLPRVSELMGGRVQTSHIRRIEIDDVLGRHQVATNLSDIAGYLTGKRVLITGAGGSIGSELARQVNKFGPGSMIMLDRDESGLHAVQLAIFGHGLLEKPDTVLVDIRDAEALRKVFEEHRPEIVFHAAALKHLPMLERFPDEGWKTNVLGTLNLLRLSAEFDVEHFVNISTDKAADASSVLGLTKRVAEQLTAWQANQTDRSLHQRPLRQRPRIAGLDAADLQRADRRRVAPSRSPTPTSPGTS